MAERTISEEQYRKLSQAQKAQYTPSITEQGKKWALKKALNFGIESIGSALGSEAAVPAVLEEGATGLGIYGSPTANTLALEAAGPTNAAAAIEGAAPIGGSFLPALGVVAGAYTGAQQIGGVKNAIKGKDLTPMQSIALALPTFGLSLGWNKIKGLWDKDEWKTEGNRLRSLREKGYNITDAQLAGMPTRGRSKEELIAMEKAAHYDNPEDQAKAIKFAETRDEQYLLPTGTVWNAMNYEKFGADYDKASTDTKLAAQKILLENRAVDEGKGTTNFNKNLTPEIEAQIRKLLNPGGAPAPAQNGQSTVPASSIPVVPKPAVSQVYSGTGDVNKDARFVPLPARVTDAVNKILVSRATPR